MSSPFIMHTTHNISSTHYAAMLRLDSEGLQLIEKLIKEPLCGLRWSIVITQLQCANQAVIWRLQILYATLMVAIINEIDVDGEDSEWDCLWYYIYERQKRLSLLNKWIKHHPNDDYLIAHP